MIEKQYTHTHTHNNWLVLMLKKDDRNFADKRLFVGFLLAQPPL